MSIQQLSLKQLRAFAEVYRAGQLSAAARKLNVTQSAVSVLIKQIETALNVQLFDRTTRSLVPTGAGEKAIGLVQRILDDIDTLDQTIRDIRDLERGIVRITATPATGLAILPRTVRRFRAEQPGIELVIDDCAPNQFLSTVREERADFGIGIAGGDSAEFDTIPLIRDRLCVVLHEDHPLAGGESIALADLKDVPLILSRRDYGVRNLVDATFQQSGLDPVIGAEVGFLSTCLWMAAAGIGVSILPRQLASLYSEDDLRVLPIANPAIHREISIVSRKGRSMSPAGTRFVEMLRADLARTSETALRLASP